MIKKTKKILNFFIIFFIIIISFEITSKLIIFIKFGHLKSPSDIIRDNNINSFVQLIEEENKCSYFSSLFPHPYLGWVHWNNPECEQNIKYNSDGFVGPEFPISNSKDYYDILITGGSVSAQFGPGIKCNNKKNNFCIDFLGEVLKNYSSRKKKPIRIFNSGAGAYKHPHQSIISILFGKNFDLIISIEGFNEHYMFQNNSNPKKISYPASNFDISTNGFFLDNPLNEFLIKFTLIFKNFSNNLIIKHSHFHALSYLILKKIIFLSTSDNSRVNNFQNLWDYKKKDLYGIDFNKFQYDNLESMWRSFIFSSNSNGADAIVIIHPVPQLFKELTDKEKEISEHKNYKDIFLKMAEI